MNNKTMMVVVDAHLAQTLVQQHRFAPTYIGVRRVRPSSRFVQHHHHQQQQRHYARFLQKQKQQQQQQPPKITPNGSTCNHSETTTSSATITKTRASNTPDRSSSSSFPNVVKFVIQDPVTGKERRMTRQEKRMTKTQLRKQKQQQQTQQQQEQPPIEKKKSKHLATEVNTTTTADSIFNSANDNEDNEKNDDESDAYYHFPLDAAALRNEMADIQGEREGVPPVALSYALAREAMVALHHHHDDDDDPTRASAAVVLYDEDLSHAWARQLLVHIQNVEALRDQDTSIRSMPYVLEPQAWKRLRPSTLLHQKVATTTTTTTIPNTTTTTTNDVDVDAFPLSSAWPSTSLHHHHPESSNDRDHHPSWFFCDMTKKHENKTDCNRDHHHHHPTTMDHVTSSFNDTSTTSVGTTTATAFEAAVVQVLFRNTALHVSCGAKFGCDYVLYQGPRCDHHAFAGIRMITTTTTTDTTRSANTNTNFADPKNKKDPTENVTSANHLLLLPLPSPYDLAGYVRGLNTAGKLALLATVVVTTNEAVPNTNDDPTANHNTHHTGGSPQELNNNTTTFRVALVDLALKKVRSTTFRKQSGTVVTPKFLPKV